MDNSSIHLQTLPLHVARHVITAMTQERAYVLPHPALRKIISHYTVYVPGRNALAEQLTIIPDASVSIACCINASDIEIHFWGPSSQATLVEKNPQKIPFYIMVEFWPGGASSILSFPLNEFHNTVIHLDQLDVVLSRLIVEQFEIHLASAPQTGLDAFLTSLDNAFLQRMEPASLFPQHVIAELQRVNGVLRIADIARRTGYSERHLNRLMSEKTGMSTKLLARIIRINAACLAMTAPSTSLTDLAHALHYHDQSHFIHDFTAICGTTPREYLQNMSVFYNEELKFGDTFPKK